MSSKLGYTTKQGLKQLFRNKTMTTTATFAITAMMLILGIFLAVILNLNAAISGVKDDYNSIELFLLDETTIERSQEIQEEVKLIDNVKTVEYRTKDVALEILKESWGENAYLLDSLGENPLPNSIIIEMDDLENAEEVAKHGETIEGVEDVTFYKDTVDRLLTVTNALQIGAGILMIFLVIVSIVVVSNTIKLTVAARKEEIMIMKYIGATNGFIRGPFVIEGISIGLISAVISGGIILLLYWQGVEKFGTDAITLLSTSLVNVSTLAIYVSVSFAVLGMLIGTFGSLLSMRRFLDK